MNGRRCSKQAREDGGGCDHARFEQRRQVVIEMGGRRRSKRAREVVGGRRCSFRAKEGGGGRSGGQSCTREEGGGKFGSF